MDNLAAQQVEVAEKSKGSKDFQDIANAYRFYDFVRAQTEYLMNEMSKAKIVSDEKREILRAAMQKDDALERLKDEQLEEYRNAEILEADNIIDDIVTARFKK